MTGRFVPESICPNCNAKLDGATVLFEEETPMPSKGDISVCIYCQTILLYDEYVKLHNPTQEQIDELKAIPEIWNQINYVRYVIRENS